MDGEKCGRPLQRRRPLPKMEPSTPRTISRPTELPIDRTTLLAIAPPSDSGARPRPPVVVAAPPPKMDAKKPGFSSPPPMGAVVRASLLSLSLKF